MGSEMCIRDRFDGLADLRDSISVWALDPVSSSQFIKQEVALIRRAAELTRLDQLTTSKLLGRNKVTLPRLFSNAEARRHGVALKLSFRLSSANSAPPRFKLLFALYVAHSVGES